MRNPLWIPALFVASACPFAQQFDHQVGAIPGTPRWTEGVEAADVDNDGDLDLFFADGDGFTTPGTKRQNKLVMNMLEVSAGTFADESVARLGLHSSNAKMAITGDIQDDGFIDAMFCNAFATDLPFLYVNDSTTPGFFTFEGVARGFTTAYSSGSGQFGDIDNDGDLDVVIGNAGQPNAVYFNGGDGLTFVAVPFGEEGDVGPPQLGPHLEPVAIDQRLEQRIPQSRSGRR